MQVVLWRAGCHAAPEGGGRTYSRLGPGHTLNDFLRSRYVSGALKMARNSLDRAFPAEGIAHVQTGGQDTSARLRNRRTLRVAVMCSVGEKW